MTNEVVKENATDESARSFRDDGCVLRFSKSLFAGAAGGALLGLGILSWYPDPYEYGYKNTRYDRALGIRYVLTGLQRPILWASLVCSTYSGVECIMEQLRDETKSSTYVNSAVAGAAAGALMGSMTKRFDIMASTALGMGMLMGMVEFNDKNNVLDGEENTDDFLSKSQIKDIQDLADLKKRYPEYRDV